MKLELSALLALVFLAACATSDFGPDTVLRDAYDTPESFFFDASKAQPGAEAKGCRNPLTDPRDGTRIHLVRSSESAGDYQVPTGRYGVRKGELLRLECGTGRVLGIVKE